MEISLLQTSVTQKGTVILPGTQIHFAIVFVYV